jgi:hypothetical protein
MIEYNDVGIARVMDITDRVDDLIYELSKEFDVNDPTVQKFFQVLQESNQLISDDKNGVFIYFGGHTIDHGDPPSPYNMMHQVVDSSRFQDDHDVARISILLDNAITYDGKNASEDPGFFEGRAQSQSYGLQAVYNLIFQAAGWLDPDTGMILSNNPTNLGTKGLSDEADIVRRCLAPKYKNDTQLIQYMVTAGFVGLLRKVITKFWNMFRGRIIVTFSNDPL